MCEETGLSDTEPHITGGWMEKKAGLSKEWHLNKNLKGAGEWEGMGGLQRSRVLKDSSV